MDFEFATATRILFGPGKVRDAGTIARSLGKRALIVGGRSPDRPSQLAGLLSAAGVESVLFSLPSEPTVADISRGVAQARSAGCDLVIGLGGGSALDGAKAMAALLANPGDLLDYLEVVGRGRPLSAPAAPCLTIPTTAGTGAEVTRNAVLASPEHRFKVSLRSSLMLPRLALVDPELTLGLPPALTVSTGLDALTQLIEPFVSHRANPLTDGFCLEGLQRIGHSLLRVVEDGGNRAAREDMSLASLLSGLALANAGLGAVHGFAAPLGGMYSAAHGALCAAVLPHAMTVNLAALQQRQPDGEALRRYARVAQVLCGHPSATASDGVAWVDRVCVSLKVAPLRALGVLRTDFPELVEKASKASSMKANPIALTPAELLDILERAF